VRRINVLERHGGQLEDSLNEKNVTGNGSMQLLPPNNLTNQSPRHFGRFQINPARIFAV
jgi:hypothetical protein